MGKYKINYEINPSEYSKVIYGDSVTGDTPLLLMKNNRIYIETIQSIFNETEKLEYPCFKILDESFRSEKNYSLSDYKVWSDQGWVTIKKVIRHKCNKKIIKILTHTGCVKVTEDHSLLTEDCQKIKPLDCVVGTKLLTSYPTFYPSEDNSISIDRAFIYGFFYGGGSFNNYDLALLKEYKMNFYTNNKKKIPSELLNSSVETIKNFFDGYVKARITINPVFDNENQVETTEFYFMLKKLGYSVSLGSGEKIIKITTSEEKNFYTKSIKKIEMVENDVDDFVYDLETDCGRFQAGVGDIIVKNTDSCMVELNTKGLISYKKLINNYKDDIKITEEEQEELDKAKTRAIEEAFVEGKLLANEVTKALFKHPINLEFEKVYTNFLILSKKRYLGNYYGKNPYTIDMIEKKGVVLKRRDNPEIVKKIYTGVVNPLLEHGERGIKMSIEFLKKELEKLMNNDVNMDDLVITKALAKGYGKISPKGELIVGDNDYKSGNLPHVALAIKMRERDPGSAPNIGDRINYVFVELEGEPQAKLYQKAEDPKSAVEKKMKIDYLYYITNQIHNPVNEILKILVSDSEKIFTDATEKYVESRNKEIKIAKIKSKIPKGQQSILKWIKPKD
jgi:hypothetical protein